MLATLGALGVAYLSYRRPSVPLGRGRRGALVSLRALVLLWILLLVSRPFQLLPPTVSGDLLVPVIVDVSRSMRIADADGQSRALRLTPTAALRLGLSTELMPGAMAAEAHVVPIIGEIAAGGPIEAYQDASERLSVPDLLAPGGDAYVLRVRGDSMVDAHIADGDYVVIRPQHNARDGDIVVAQVEENAVTLKRFYREKDRIRLQPANEAYAPQFYPDVRIQGKLIGVIRRVD